MVIFGKLKYCIIWCFKIIPCGKEIIATTITFRIKIRQFKQWISVISPNKNCDEEIEEKCLGQGLPCPWVDKDGSSPSAQLCLTSHKTLQIFYLCYLCHEENFQNHAGEGSYKGVGCPWLIATDYIRKFSLGEV